MPKDLTSQIEALQKNSKANGRQIFLEMKYYTEPARALIVLKSEHSSQSSHSTFFSN